LGIHRGQAAIVPPWIRNASAVAPNRKLALATHERFAARMMLVSVRQNNLQAAVAIQLANLFLPRTAAIRRPLKGQRLDVPRLPVKIGRQF
jgi:hypothetical protein